jgi:iron(II)-dependent oxidoreductase
MPDSETLTRWVADGRARSLHIVNDLSDEQLRVPWLPTVNPILWELCHASFFYESFLLRDGAGQEPVLQDSGALFDSMTIGHETRWRLPVPDRAGSLAYGDAVRQRVVDLIDKGLDERLTYLLMYSVFHGDMHNEALTYTRQALGYPAPSFDVATADVSASDEAQGDATLPGGVFVLGATTETPFCFDNEKWGHEIEVQPFAIARTAVTEGEVRDFVLEGGYDRREFWSPQGWAWREAVQASLPLYWRHPGGKDFERRHFDRWIPIEDRRAAIHISWYEADAWCRWAKRRLPTEAEWEMAAARGEDDAEGKRRHPWGNDPPSTARCNMDWKAMGPVDVSACSAGDSAAGCRQMTGNVWEWTATTFAPYPEFTPDMYADYSQTSFHTRKVLRGGCWATPSRTIRNTWRNFFQPARRDVFAGFRTCRV